MTTTSPAAIVPSSSASIAARSRSKTRAVPSKTSASKPAVFTTAPSGASEPAQDRQAAGAVDRLGHRPEHLAVDVGRGDVGEVLGHRAAGDGQDVAVQQPGVEQRPHHHRDAADPVDVGHDVLAERLDVGQVRHLRADPVEVVERQVDLGLVGDREQVQHRVGRAAERHHDGDRVLERLAGEDVAGGDAAAAASRRRPRRTAGRSRPAAGRWRAARRCRAATCPAPRRRWPSCSPCTCRRRRPRPGRSPARSRRRPRGSSGPRAQAPTASKASMIVTCFSVPSESFAMPGRIDPA